jgi:shikimate kinase
MNNIILTGFASCGKSAAATALSGATGCGCVDLDRVIESVYEKKYGNAASCREIFRSGGEQVFSELETEALETLSGMRSSILSTGGRAPMKEQNRTLLKSMGRIVYLKCGVEVILERMKNKGVPASMGSSLQEISEEWNRRDPVYSALADIVIVNDTQSPNETALAILSWLVPDSSTTNNKG